MKEVTSLKHPIVKHLVKLRQDKRYRSEQKRVLITSLKVIKEISASFPLITLIQNKSLDPKCALTAKNLIITTDEIIKKITGLKSPEGIAAEIELPSMQDLSHKSPLLILDKVSDPGNMGTLFRSALAFGFKGVFITDSSVDPFHEKVISASRGAVFQIPIAVGSPLEFQKLCNDYHVLVADLRGKSIADIDMQQKMALVLGSESHGPNSFFTDQFTAVTIPMEKMESLNVAVAGSIIMHTMREKL